MRRARRLRVTDLIGPRHGQGGTVTEGAELAHQQRLRVGELGEPGPDVIAVLFETGEPLIELSGIRQLALKALELASGAPPGDGEPDGADGPDLGRSEEEDLERTH